MSEPIILLVGGRLTSGKDAFADHLVENHDFVKLGMSDTLALALYRLNPWVLAEKGPGVWRYQTIVDRVGYVEAKKNPEVRRLLQVLGTEVGRQLLGENIWVDATKKKIQELAAEGKNVVLTGIRYENEIALERNLAGIEIVTSIWVERPGLEPTSQHSSEGSVAANDFEYVLPNTGTLQDLYKAADALLEEILNDFN